MRLVTTLIVPLMLAACAAPGESSQSREDTAMDDFIEVNELDAAVAIRTTHELRTEDVSETYLIVSTRDQDYLLEYYNRCLRNPDGRVVPDVRTDSRAIHPRVDTFRGCRIKAIYALGPGQAEEVRNLGRFVVR